VGIAFKEGPSGGLVPRFARGSLPWMLVPFLLTLALAAFVAWPGLEWVAWLAIAPGLVTVFFVQFFRDPDRVVAEGVASPADGKVVRIDEVDDPDLGRVERVAVFMSPKDVHVNRIPLDGKVLSVRHIPGGHIPAFNKDAHNNERVETVLATAIGRVKVIQIAGTVARRIVPYLQGDETVAKGDRMGLIRLGSRCDLLVPPGSVSWSVQLQQQVYGSKTSLGTLTAEAVRHPQQSAGDRGTTSASRSSEASPKHAKASKSGPKSATKAKAGTAKSSAKAKTGTAKSASKAKAGTKSKAPKRSASRRKGGAGGP
jgi:phosphatidylserine decarboxylase